jgi:ubiquinone/menaquinone biosynthesis C-methylase UbiE
MSSEQTSKPNWGTSYRLIAAEKWKAKSAAMGRDVTAALVNYARPEPGMKVLDLASGTGEPAISLAQRVGPAGHVTAVDLSAELLAIATERARQRNLDNFSSKQADAHELPFHDRTFDLITCRFGIMFFADPGKALTEAYRVLNAGRRACFLAWGTFDQPYWATTMGVVQRHVGGPAIAPGEADPFRFAEPGSLSEALRDAAFDDVEESIEDLPWNWPGPPEEVWEYARSVSTPFRPLLDRVARERWSEINADVHTAISQYVEGEVIHFGARVVFAAGRKS